MKIILMAIMMIMMVVIRRKRTRRIKTMMNVEKQNIDIFRSVWQLTP